MENTDVDYVRRVIGSRLFVARQQRRMTRVFVHKETGIGLHLLRRIETNKTDPKLAHVLKLCALYRISMTVLLSESFDLMNWGGYYEEFVRQLGRR